MINNKKESDIGKLVIILFMLLPIITISWKLDNDIWFLLNHGRYVVENGIPYTEPFTIHENFKFVMQQWLFSSVTWLIYSNLGKWAIILACYIIGLSVILVTYKLCMLLSDNAFFISSIVTVLSNVFILSSTITRPQSVTLLILVSELFFLEKYIHTQNSKYLIALPILSLIEINCHASMWFMQFAFILPYLINSFKIKIGFIKSEGYKKLPLFITVMIMFAVGFINPYGLDAITYVFKSYGNESINKNIIEMVPTALNYSFGKFFFAVAVIVALIYVFNKSGKTEIRFVLLLAGTTLLALMNLKGVVYFFIGGVIPLSYFLKNLGQRLKPDFSSKKGRRMLSLLLVLIIFVYITFFAVSLINYDPNDDLPEVSDAVEYLLSREKAEDITLYVGYNNGGYTEFYGIKSYIDPRAEVFLKKNNKQKDVFDEYINLGNGEIHYKDFFARYDFTHILVTNFDFLHTYLSADDDYKVMYKDDNCTIFIPANKA